MITQNKTINSNCLLIGIYTENIFPSRFNNWKANPNYKQKKPQTIHLDIFSQQYVTAYETPLNTKAYPIELANVKTPWPHR